MKRRLVISLALLVLVPLSVLVWTGVRMARQDAEQARSRVADVLRARLGDVRERIARFVGERERSLLQVAALPALDADSIRAAVMRAPGVRQIFLLDADGSLLHPPGPEWRTAGEQAFMERTRALLENGERFYRAPENGPGGGHSHGWYTWFWGNGIDLIFWRRLPDGRVLGIELDRAAFMADVIGMLPDSVPDLGRVSNGGDAGRLTLLDESGRTIYQWGAYEPAVNEAPWAALPLAEPLGSWSLAYHAPASTGLAIGRSAFFNVVSALAVAAVALLIVAVVVYRETSREMREAATRVSFVNQVSHELKTPLTNIRMYGELLEGRVPPGDEKARQYLDVVLSESRRLGRLINNVLTFARGQRKSLRLRPAPGVVDEVIAAVLAGFEPTLSGRGMAVEFEGGAGGPGVFDRDALEQILVNLISNVEKYAAAGKLLRVTSQERDGLTRIAVEDRGAGIPENRRERVFEPFVRLSDRLNDGTAGAGIGLSIVRELARLHGGDAVMEPAEQGARCVVTLVTGGASAEGASGMSGER